MKFVVFLFLLSSCAHKTENQGKPICYANLAIHGEPVRLVRTASELKNCRMLGDVTSPRCRGERQSQYHSFGLRNAAGALGADHVLALSLRQQDQLVKGQAFVCREVGAAVQSPPQLPAPSSSNAE